MGEPSNSDDVKKATDNAPGFESGAFEALENDFQEVLQELVGDKSLERFRNEYDKLHRALKKSHESEKRLIKKCRELNQEIVANAAKVQTALKLSQEDQNTIASLKREIEKATDPAAMRAQKIAEFRERFASPYVAAERGYVDEVILPRTTRAKLVRALATLDHKRDKNPPKKHGNIPL